MPKHFWLGVFSPKGQGVAYTVKLRDVRRLLRAFTHSAAAAGHHPKELAVKALHQMLEGADTDETKLIGPALFLLHWSRAPVRLGDCIKIIVDEDSYKIEPMDLEAEREKMGIPLH